MSTEASVTASRRLAAKPLERSQSTREEPAAGKGSTRQDNRLQLPQGCLAVISLTLTPGAALNSLGAQPWSRSNATPTAQSCGRTHISGWPVGCQAAQASTPLESQVTKPQVSGAWPSPGSGVGVGGSPMKVFL